MKKASNSTNAERQPLKGKALVEALRRKFANDKNGPATICAELSSKLGISAQALWNWQTRDSRISGAQIANLVQKARSSERRNTEKGAIRPIVEFYELDAADSKHQKRMELFSTELRKKNHRYLAELKTHLRATRGIYIFYDSRGRALYCGQAKDQSLWNEIKNAFNRDRHEHQRIYRTTHPQRNVKFVPASHRKRRIIRSEVPLYELASYLSAYEVPIGLISSLEALLVRGFANDLLNARIENFPKSLNGRFMS